MVLIAVAAELLDVLTYAVQPLTGHYERNPVIAGLATTAPLAKLLLLVAVLAIAFAIRRIGRYEKARQAMLAVAVVAGCVGTASNLL